MTAADHKEKLSDLKEHLAQLQEKISEIEGTEPEEEEIRDLINWKSPVRVFRPRTKRWALNLALIVAIIVVILLFLNQFILMAAILAMAFLVYVVSSIPPEDIEHKITTQGVTTAERSFIWKELYDFWFTEKGEWEMLHISTNVNYPRILFMLLKKEDKEKVKDILAEYIPYREQPNYTWYDKLSHKLSDQFHNLVGS